MKYLLSISNAADVRTIVTHDLQELGIRFDTKKDQEVSTTFRKSRSRENSLVSINTRASVYICAVSGTQDISSQQHVGPSFGPKSFRRVLVKCGPANILSVKCG